MKLNNYMIDWLEFSVFDLTFEQVVSILDLNELVFECKRSFYYEKIYAWDECIYLYDGAKGAIAKQRQHIHVKITGRGCRYLENKYSNTLREEVLARLLLVDINVSRMDIAMDYDQKFVKQFVQSALDYKFQGNVKSRQVTISNSATIYLGSKSSQKFFRMYEKDIESKEPENYKDRVELVLRDQYATNEFNNKNSLDKIASTYMSEIQWTNEMEEVWKSLQCGTCEISPKISHVKTKLLEKVDNIMSRFGKTLKAYVEVTSPNNLLAYIGEQILGDKEYRLMINEKQMKRDEHKQKVFALLRDKIFVDDKPLNIKYIQQFMEQCVIV